MSKRSDVVAAPATRNPKALAPTLKARFDNPEAVAQAVEIRNASPHPPIPERPADGAIGEPACLTEPKPGQVRMRMTAARAHVIVERRDGPGVQADDPFASTFTRDADAPPL